MTKTGIGPADFAPFRAEISGCYCKDFCLPMAYLVSLDSGRHNGSAEHAQLGVSLLVALSNGSHVKVTAEQYRRDFPATAGRGYVTLRVEM